MGIAATATVRSKAELRAVVAELAPSARAGHGRPPHPAGALFIVAKVKESAPTAKPPLDCVFIKQRFMSAIGSPQSAIEGAAL